MTRQDFFLKWFFYALATLPIWWLGAFVLNRFPVMGVIPMVLPLAAAAVAVMEGPAGGAGFGLFIGVLCDATYYGEHGVLTIVLCLTGWAAGVVSRYVLRPNFGGCVLCSAGVLGVLGLGQVAWGLFTRLATLPVLLQVAVPEFLWSMVFLLPIYPWYFWAKKHIYHFLRMKG